MCCFSNFLKQEHIQAQNYYNTRIIYPVIEYHALLFVYLLDLPTMCFSKSSRRHMGQVEGEEKTPLSVLQQPYE